MLFCERPEIQRVRPAARGGRCGGGASAAMPAAGATPTGGARRPVAGSLKEVVRAETERVERELIQRALDETGGNVTQAARKLKISRKSLQTKMKELGLRERRGPGPCNKLGAGALCYRRGTSLAPTLCKKSSWAVVPADWCWWPLPARGAEVTRVVSALDDDNRFDFNLTATWFHDVKSALVKRELAVGARVAQTELIKDLSSRRRATSSTCAPTSASSGTSACTSTCRMVLRTRTASTSIKRRVRLHLSGERHRARPTCVNSTNSTILRDGILPGVSAHRSWGLDAQHNRTVLARRRERRVRRRRTCQGPARGLRVPGRRPDLGGVQPAA